MDSSLSLPLSADGRSVGALSLYASEVGAFSVAHEHNAGLFAACAAGAIATALRLAHQVQLTEQPRAALPSRAVIDQAIGIFLRDGRCGPDEAFEVLRAASNAGTSRCGWSRRKW